MIHAPTPAEVGEALSKCRLVRAITGDVPFDTMTAFAMACAAAMPNPEVAELFLSTLCNACADNAHNRSGCYTYGTLAVVDATRTYGSYRSSFAAEGCKAFRLIAWGDRLNADEIVFGAGGVDVILDVMAAHPMDEDVQKEGCWALCAIARVASFSLSISLRFSFPLSLCIYLSI